MTPGSEQPLHVFDQTNGVVDLEVELDEREQRRRDHAAANGIVGAAVIGNIHS